METIAQLEILLEGAPEDGAFVRLNDFRIFLDDLQGALRAVEAEVDRDAESPLQYRIVGLEVGSARVCLRPEESDPRVAQLAPRVLTRLTDTLDAVSQGRELEGTTHETLTALQRLGGAYRRHVRGIDFGVNGTRVTLPRDFEERVRHLLRRVTRSQGTLRGRLDAINVHQRPHFSIYPVTGPAKVRCLYQEEQIPDIGRYLGRYVEVEGTLHFHGDEVFPHEIIVSTLRAMPDPRGLPRADELVGSLPDVTGGLDVLDYLAELRAEDH